MASSSLNKDLLDLFDCPICMKFLYPPIYQCPKGHHMCWPCKYIRNNKCPTCGNWKDIGSIRSLPLEKVADTILFPCKYREKGCAGSYKYDRKQKHEEECGHRPYECPFPCSPRCTVTGDAKKLVSHLTDDHHVRVERSDTIESPMIYLDSTLEVGSGTLVIHDCHSEHFILQWVNVGNGVICVYVIFMGEQQEAKKYLCKLEIGEEQNGKMTWKGTPRPIREEYTSNYCGLTFHTRGLLCSSTSTISPTCILNVSLIPSKKTSPNQMMMAARGTGSNLTNLLDCPICSSFMYPPIFQCPNGHIICSNCKQRLNNRCPSCPNEIGDIRSLIIEKMAESLVFPCKFNGSGCPGSFKYELKGKHEEECRYRPYDCPFPCSPSCVAKGDAKQLVTHLRDHHQSDVQTGVKIDTLFTIVKDDEPRTSGKIIIYSCLSVHFCLHCEALDASNGRVYVYLTYMGDDEDAGKFSCKLKVENNSRKIAWRGSPKGIRQEVERIRESSHGVVLDRSMVALFAEVNSRDQVGLRVRGSISEYEPPRRGPAWEMDYTI